MPLRRKHLHWQAGMVLILLLLSTLLSACGGSPKIINEASSQPTANQIESQAQPSSSQPTNTQPSTTTRTPSPMPSATAIPLPPSGDWAITADTASLIENLYEMKLSKVGDVVDIAWSPDGKNLAVLGPAGILMLDGETLEINGEFQVSGRNSYVSFSANNQLLVATNAITYQTQIWNLADGSSKMISNTGHLSAISPDGKILAAVEDIQQYSADGYPGPIQVFLRLFDVQSGKMIRDSVSSYTISDWVSFFPDTIGLYFSPDGKTVQTVNALGDVRSWNINSGQLINTSVNPYTRERLSSGFCQADHTTGNSFAVMCEIAYMDPPCIENTPGCEPTAKGRYEVGLWDANRLQRKRNLVIKDETAYLDVALVPENDVIILFTLESLEYWNATAGKMDKSVPTNQTISNWFKSSMCSTCRKPITAVKPGTNGEVIAISHEGKVILWNSADQTEMTRAILDLRQVTSASMGTLNNQPVLAVGLSDGSVMMVNPASGDILQTIEAAHEGKVGNVALGADGNTLITTGAGSAKWWRLDSVEPFHVEAFDHRSDFLANPFAGVLAMSQETFDQKNTLLDSRLMLVDFYTGKSRPIMDSWIAHLSISLDGNWLATERLDKVSLWNFNTLEWIRDFELPANNTYITAIALNPDSSALAVAQTNTISVMDVNTNTIITQVTAEATINQIAFDPSGCLLAAGDNNGNLYLIDAKNRKLLSNWAAHAGRINNLSFSQDGRLLMSQAEDGSVRLWGQAGASALPTGELLSLACKASSPPLTSTPVTPTATPTPVTPTPTPTQVAYYRPLALSDPMLTGNDVLQLQKRLVQLGYTQIGIPDGIFGPKTDQAVRQYQQDNGLVIDGIVGPLTWKQLFGE
ncbi:peptidoglycan-binding protein [Ornatilinea apprima]|nr:peptidoglycan-binding protein [Ornatilinea apprima]